MSSRNNQAPGPREKLRAEGARKLSDTELLAAIIGTGTKGAGALETACRLLFRYGNSLSRLASLNVRELAAFKGIGPAKAARILAAAELGKRVVNAPPSVRVYIRNSADAARLLLPDMRGLKKEIFKIILLDTKNALIKTANVSEGTLNASLTSPREVFKTAIYEAAASVVLAHNHPSGDPSPSAEDIALTSRLSECGKILGIKVQDHIIIGDGTYKSIMNEV